jgi:hypothetical protein
VKPHGLGCLGTVANDLGSIGKYFLLDATTRFEDWEEVLRQAMLTLKVNGKIFQNGILRMARAWNLIRTHRQCFGLSVLSYANAKVSIVSKRELLKPGSTAEVVDFSWSLFTICGPSGKVAPHPTFLASVRNAGMGETQYVIGLSLPIMFGLWPGKRS